MAGRAAIGDLVARCWNRCSRVWAVCVLADAVLHSDHAIEHALGSRTFEALFRGDCSLLRPDLPCCDARGREAAPRLGLAGLPFRIGHLHVAVRTGMALLWTFGHWRREPVGP